MSSYIYNSEMPFIPFILSDYPVVHSFIQNHYFDSNIGVETSEYPSTMPLEQPHTFCEQWKSAALEDNLESNYNFELLMDVQGFSLKEITVKLNVDNTITIEGKQEEKQDEHGFISRQFVEKFPIPDGCDLNKIEAKLYADGYIIVTAPKMEQKLIKSINIPIQLTGECLRLNSMEQVSEIFKSKI